MLGRGLKWFCVLVYGLNRIEGREKLIYWCMPLFLPYLFLFYVFYSSLPLSFIILSLFFFFFSFLYVSFLLYSLFFFFFPSLCVYLPLSLYTLFMATFLPFILLEFIGFLPFVPKASPTVFGFLWASLQDCPLTCWLLGHYLCSECACHTTLHS